MVDVKLANVSKKRGDKLEVDDLSFTVRDKELFIILGPPGSGKSMVLRLIAGLDSPDAGEIYIGGELVNAVPPQKRDVAMVFQNLALYPHLNGFENVAFPLRKRGTAEDEIKAEVSKIAKTLGIEHLLSRLPQTYSGGELQRVALARAMVRKARVFLMDQPLSGLDAMIRANMRVELKSLVKESGLTIVYTTHDSIEALSMADRIAVMNEGRFQQLGTPEEVYGDPPNTFVASFVGSPQINLIDATIQKKKGRTFLSKGNFLVEIRAGEDMEMDQEVTLGVRPEDLKIDRKSESGLIAEIYMTEFLGSKSIFTLTLLDGQIVKAVLPASEVAEIGERVCLAFNSSRIKVFDKKTGVNLKPRS